MGNRFNQINITALVKSILENDDRTRNSDSLLYLCVLKQIEMDQEQKLNGVTVFDFLLNLQGKVYPPFESVRRARQKVQNAYPNLVACDEVLALRADREAEMYEYARGEV